MGVDQVAAHVPLQAGLSDNSVMSAANMNVPAEFRKEGHVRAIHGATGVALDLCGPPVRQLS